MSKLNRKRPKKIRAIVQLIKEILEGIGEDKMIQEISNDIAVEQQKTITGVLPIPRLWCNIHSIEFTFADGDDLFAGCPKCYEEWEAID